MSTGRDTRPHRRPEVVDAAMAVLARDGHAEFSVDGVRSELERAGSASPEHLGDRNELMVEAVYWTLADMRRGFGAAFAAETGPLAPEAAGDALWDVVHRFDVAAVVGASIASVTDPELNALLQPVLDEHEEHMNDMIDASIERLPADVQRRVLGIAHTMKHAMVGVRIDNMVGLSEGHRALVSETLLRLYQYEIDQASGA